MGFNVENSKVLNLYNFSNEIKSIKKLNCMQTSNQNDYEKQCFQRTRISHIKPPTHGVLSILTRKHGINATQTNKYYD